MFKYYQSTVNRHQIIGVLCNGNKHNVNMSDFKPIKATKDIIQRRKLGFILCYAFLNDGSYKGV
jgi:hypothetical protein